MTKTGHGEIDNELFSLFVEDLRRALRDLYNPAQLRNNRIMDLLPVNPLEGYPSLQKLLSSAIEDLKPSSSLSLQSDAWRIYNTLTSRYIQQFQQSEIAQSIGVSIRHMRRMDNQSVHALAEHIWNKYNLLNRENQKTKYDATSFSEMPSREEELAWIKKSAEIEGVDLKKITDSLIKTIEPFAKSVGVTLQSNMQPEIPVAYIRVEPLRQAWINLLTTIIRQMRQGTLAISVKKGFQHVVMEASVPFSPLFINLSDHEAKEDMHINYQLVEFAGGKLSIQQADSETIITVTIPVTEVVKVLAIDDNVDTLTLIERYLQNSNYLFLGTSEPKEALAIALHQKPDIIILDLAIPEIDGWELLATLREHPDLKNARIIVCSVLPQETLSIALGAAVFLRKPINQTVLLKTLAQLSRPSLGFLS